MKIRTLVTHPAVIAAVVAVAVSSGSATASSVKSFITNAGTVDGQSAVKYTTSPSKRKKRLVATNSSGYLPNNIIAKAPNSNKLDGLDSTDFLRATAQAADANTLDGVDSTSFLQQGAAAGGALTGSYPNPTLAAGSVSTTAAAGWPNAKVYDSNSDQVIADATPTALTFDTESFDTAGVHSTSSNTSRLTAPVAGIYVITGNVHWGGTSNDERLASIVQNGSTTLAQVRVAQDSANEQYENVTAIVQLAAGDYVELVVEQNAGFSGTPVVAGSASESNFALSWAGPVS